jgi:hypothetical protein
MRRRAAPEQEILTTESVKNPTIAAMHRPRFTNHVIVFPVLFLIKSLPRVTYNPIFRTNNPKLMRLMMRDVLPSSIYLK